MSTTPTQQSPAQSRTHDGVSGRIHSSSVGAGVALPFVMVAAGGREVSDDESGSDSTGVGALNSVGHANPATSSQSAAEKMGAK